MLMLLNIHLLFFLWRIHGNMCSLSCKNENNNDVDWFILLKIPASYNYFYLSSDSNNAKWNIPNYSLNDGKNLLAVTLRQMYNYDKNNAFFALYNDAKPIENLYFKKSEKGHLKGMINFDKESGYWLVHSVPKFPSQDKYDYSNGESINGQSFFCVSLKFQDLKSIASQLLLMYADVYAYNFPAQFSHDEDLMNTLYRLVLNEHAPGLMAEQINLSTVGGLRLAHFAKSHENFKDLYLDIMAPRLNASLFTETWMNGPGDRLPSNCQTSNKVYNVKMVSIEGISYSESVDHSKWAVSASSSQPIVCIGDINRMATQKFRGGGSLCVFDFTIWKTYFPIVKSYEPCPTYDFIL